MTPADMLEAGAAWLAVEEHGWCRDVFATDGTKPVNPLSDEATCWCGAGAVYAATLKDNDHGAFQAFLDVYDSTISTFNDHAMSREQVIAAMREAAAAWRAQNQGAAQ